MKSVIDNNIELIIKKSKFITLTYNINSIEDVKIKLNELNNKYNDATHICYAYIVNNEEKCSDNGEPSGTAGMPILNVLKKENLNIPTILSNGFDNIDIKNMSTCVIAGMGTNTIKEICKYIDSIK